MDAKQICPNCLKEFAVVSAMTIDAGTRTWFSCVGSDANCCSLPCLIEFIAKEKVEKVLKEKGISK